MKDRGLFKMGNGARCRVQGAWCRLHGAGCMVQGAGCSCWNQNDKTEI